MLKGFTDSTYMPVNFWTVIKKLNYGIKIVHLSYFIFGCITLQDTK